jgi:hypothetical protein
MSKQKPTQVKDSGKIKFGGAAPRIIKSPVKDSGKIKVGGASLNLIRR